MAKIAFVFPGQGSQYVGMGRDLYEIFPLAREIFDEAEDILGLPVKELCFEGPEEELRLTSNTQPALFVTSLVCQRLLEERGVHPDVVAGHSVGEYSALVTAGALSFEEGLRLVRRRGELMQQATNGSMAAIIGLSEEVVLELCERASFAGVVCVANYNSPGQLVISGSAEAVAVTMEYAREAGARKVVALNVSGAFHSPLMNSAAEQLASEIARVSFQDPEIPVVANVTADYLRSASEVRDALIRQVAGSVRWSESVARIAGDGVSLFVEVGPGKVLSGLVRRIVDTVDVVNVGDVDSMNEFFRNFAGNNKISWLEGVCES